jgi:hypothetical protein
MEWLFLYKIFMIPSTERTPRTEAADLEPSWASGRCHCVCQQAVVRSVHLFAVGVLARDVAVSI